MKLDAPEVTIFTNMPHTHASAAQGGPSTAPETVAATAKATPVDADQLPLVDSAASNVLKKLTWVNVKATLKAYFDTLYTNNTGTVTSVAAITLGTTGTDLSSTVATGTTTPVITLQVPSASGANRGALLAADWTTFNNKQVASTTGSWTIGVTFGGGNTGVVLAEDAGYWVKTGKIVTLTGTIRLTNKGSSTGVAVLTGIPFPTVSGPPYGNPRCGGVIGQANIFNTITNIRIWADHSASTLQLITNMNTNVTDVHFTNTSALNGISITYITA